MSIMKTRTFRSHAASLAIIAATTFGFSGCKPKTDLLNDQKVSPTVVINENTIEKSQVLALNNLDNTDYKKQVDAIHALWIGKTWDDSYSLKFSLLVDKINSDRVEVRRAALTELGNFFVYDYERIDRSFIEIIRAGAVPSLLKAIKDKDMSIRELAARRLGRIGTNLVEKFPQIIPALMYGLDDDCWQVRAESAYALGRLAGRSAVPPLLRMLKDDNEDVRKHAVWALGMFACKGERSIIPVLIKALENEYEVQEVRQSIAIVLGNLKATSSISSLIKILKDENMRYEAISALGEIGDASAVPTLIEFLKDSDLSSRQEAARALGMIGDTSAVLPLIKLLKDNDSQLRGIAASALGKIGDVNALWELNQLSRKDPELNVRDDALRALTQISRKTELSIRDAAESAIDSIRQNLL